jgi:hypothetical protein
MKKNKISAIIILIFITFFISSSTVMYSSSVIEKIRPTLEEVPSGFMFGQIPGFAQSLLKANPWSLDQTAIKKLTHRIYPGAEYSKVADLHMTIIANKKNPYGDDIVCYIFIFKNEKSAIEEMNKLNEFVRYNKDRGIIVEKKNLAVFLLVDDVKNYDHIKTMSEVIKKRLESL